MSTKSATPAAKENAAEMVTEYEFPRDAETLKQLLQLAFIAGAQWYNKELLADTEQRLAELETAHA